MITKLWDLEKELGFLPDQVELDRLVSNYVSYELLRRKNVLNGYFEGKTLKELIKIKLIAVNIEISELSSQSLGGHGRWVKVRVQRLIIRIWYSRYYFDQDMSRIKANQEIFKKYGSEKLGQPSIRSITRFQMLHN